MHNEMESRTLPAPLAALLARRFERIVVFSGAGMSADSGIPTFRSGSNGLWGEFDPQQLATPQAWHRDKATVWGWYEWRRGQVMAATPNPGHVAVARLQREFGAQVVTQNVDDLHERAGVEGALHLHGSLFAARCDRCGAPHELADPPPEAQRRLTPPACGHCAGGAIRPGVVWFGEGLDDGVVNAAAALIAACDLLLIVGTSGVVYPAAGMVRLAPKDAVIVEINPQPGDVAAEVDHRWQTTAAIGLPAVAAALVDGVGA
ncbi:NAD-dependent protein deacylase [Mitsuaria sp. GD03876]|uniref:NAD-dependent protein deacylase n=1 Tax=Mitsuaria sp. GD03876 TaxID=2975399 RepID=UPI00244D2B01|nr:NAD-dependent protein deacylase [Mitsuaria sp. GD03876]MDH0863829.1 NAD-dependent protein deacylase [Mitsuaria sp. GD03876]